MSERVAVLVSAIALVIAAAAPAAAQSTPALEPGFEFLVPGGTLVPTGSRDDRMTRGNLTAVQLSYGLRPDLVVTGTVGWARLRPLRMGDDARLDMFTYDIGAECRVPRRSADGFINFKPFTGLGVGGRTYSYRHADTATSHNLAVYASAGGELGVGRVRVRLEARDYMSGATDSDAPGSSRLNDVTIMAGLRLALR